MRDTDQSKFAFAGIRKKRKMRFESSDNSTESVETANEEALIDINKEEQTHQVETSEQKTETVQAPSVRRKLRKKTKSADISNNKVIAEPEQIQQDSEGRKIVIEVKDLYKIYRVGSSKVRALNGVDFTVYEGEFCAIVGTSGSGKSTLLNMLAGLEKPTKGEITIAGHHIEKMNENRLVRFRQKNVGFIFQSFNLLGTMNAIENVALPLSFRGVSKAVRLKKAKKMLKLVGLSKHALHRPNQMSGGQQQRVGMARALVVNPKIVFADEPTGNLDSKTSKEMMNLMRRIVNEHKKTLIMVTHDDSLAAIADKVIRIVDGKIVSIEDRSMKKTEENDHEKANG